ncbi:MAG: FAD-dependent oxidoreductase [Pseudomonadota bacterium]
MSKSENVAVIGAGIVGVSTAIWLQRMGLKVTLIDREGPAAGTSFGNAGILAASAVVPVTVPGLLQKAPGMLFSPSQPLFLRWSYLPRLMPFLMRYLSNANLKDLKRISTDLHQLMYDCIEQHKALAEESGAAKYIGDPGYLHAYESEASFRKDSLAWETRRETGMEFEELDADQLAEYDPALAGKFGYAMLGRLDGRVTDPGAYVKALANHFEAEGGEILIAEVTDIMVKEGRATGVVTAEHGHVEATEIVVTAGAWSGVLARKLGIKVPLEAERGYHVEFVGANVNLRSPVMVTEKKFAMNSMDGRLRCAGIVEFGGLEAGPSKAPVELLKNQVAEMFPDLKYEGTREWLGHRPSTPDSLPLIGAFEKVPNVWAGFGHQHLGLTGAPKTGRWLANMISGEMPNVDMTPYSPDRF